MRIIARVWHQAFLDERPAVALGFFRVAVALTVGLHVIPTFLPLADIYLHTAFKEYNPSFFPIGVLAWVQKSPDWLVVSIVGGFLLFWVSFLVGFRAQISCILLNLCCYYFYALNSLHIGTLSWDILLVTMFLMCVTGYHGDYFSVDAWLRRRRGAEEPPPRPFFIQRLLQLQIAWNYFYTGLYKITAEGNWLTDNPMYYLFNYPPEGVTKHFPLREFLASQPDLCYWIGIAVIVMEMSLPFLWFIPRTRYGAIAVGWVFHVLLLVTLHVPTIFLFLFPPQMLLFVPTERYLTYFKQKS